MIMDTREMNETVKNEKRGKEDFYIIVFEAKDEVSKKHILSDLHNSFIEDQDYINADVILSDFSIRDLTNSPYIEQSFKVYLCAFHNDYTESIFMDRLRYFRTFTLEVPKNVSLLNEQLAPDSVKKFVNDYNNTIKKEYNMKEVDK